MIRKAIVEVKAPRCGLPIFIVFVAADGLLYASGSHSPHANPRADECLHHLDQSANTFPQWIGFGLLAGHPGDWDCYFELGGGSFEPANRLGDVANGEQ